MSIDDRAAQRTDRQRWRLLVQLEGWLEIPLLVLGFVWLALLIVELVRGPTALMSAAQRWIWILFIVDFAMRLLLAPSKVSFLRHNLITALALALPALRTLRILRFARLLRAGRGVTLVRILTSTNRGISALRSSMQRRGAGYVVALTVLVVLAGAAGMYAFENGGSGFATYSEALWWTAMLITSLGSEAWPQTPEGRLLCFLLGLYGFAVFGYLTAILASFFVDRDAASTRSAVAGAAELKSLENELRALRNELKTLTRRE